MSRNATVTVLFCDLVGSTARFARMGDDAADLFLMRFRSACRTAVEAHGGQVIKSLGDGIMAVYASSTLGALLSAGDLHEAIAKLAPSDPPRLRIGVSMGEANESDGDWHGTPVIEASRLCDTAGTGETYTTSTVRAVVGSRGTLAFSPLGLRELKGLQHPVDIVRLDHHVPAGRTSKAASSSEELLDGRRSTGGHKSRRWLLATGVIVVVAVVGITLAVVSRGDSEGNPTVSGGGDLGYEPEFAARPCDRDAIDGQKCGVLRVPERRDRPKGRWNEVVVDEYLPTEPGPRMAVMVGDLEPPQTSLSRFKGTLLRMTPRGLAGDPTLECPDVAAAGRDHLTEPLLGAPSADAYISAIGTCASSWDEQGYDRSAYDTEDIALDVRDLAIAKGLEPVDLLVGTEDTSVGLALLRDHADLLRTVTLVNPILPTASTGDYVRSYSEAVADFAAVCRDDDRCNKYLPDADAAWRALYHQLQTTPVHVSGQLPDGSTAEVLVDGDRAASVFAYAIGLGNLQVYVPQILANNQTAAIASNARDRSGVVDQPYGANYSDLCHRVVPIEKPADRDVITRLPEFAVGIWRTPLLSRVCKAWPVDPAGDRFRAPVTTKVPVMVLTGELASNTQRSWADDISVGFTNHAVLRFATIGFDPLMDGPACLRDIRLRWLDDPTKFPTPAEITACEAATPAVGFYG